MEKEKKHKKRKRHDNDNHAVVDVKESASRPKKDSKKRKKDSKREKARAASSTSSISTASPSREDKAKVLHFPYQYILAPMVGASELAFRLLCRQYGTQLAYTPMMAANKFAHDATYRDQEFQTCPADRPLVCHFCANTPQDFAAAAQTAAPYCDAIDLNLGCP